jgi:hypothetical protein
MNEHSHNPHTSHLRALVKNLAASRARFDRHQATGRSPLPAETPAFDDLMQQVMASADRFGHRQHIHLTWLAVRRYGTAAASAVVSDGIQQTARYAGAPQKYNATVSRAWVELVGHHTTEPGTEAADFAAFADHHTALLDKRLLTRFYRPATLASAQARTGWIEPDLRPFPWVDADT